MPSVILTDEHGAPTGSSEIVAAHLHPGKLHKAFSVYVLRGKDILIQKRSDKKMLWPMIWANTCCSHPREGEAPMEAGQRRLKEELGFTCALREAGDFVYRAEDPAGRGVEHEHVTVLVGEFLPTMNVTPDPAEVAEFQWISIDDLEEKMKDSPHDYAPWLHLGLPIALHA